MSTFDARATLAKIRSSEAEVPSGSVIVTAATEHFLEGLAKAFVRFN